MNPVHEPRHFSVSDLDPSLSIAPGSGGGACDEWRASILFGISVGCMGKAEGRDRMKREDHCLGKSGTDSFETL